MNDAIDFIILFLRMAIESGFLLAILLTLRAIARQLTAVEARLVQVLVNDELEKKKL